MNWGNKIVIVLVLFVTGIGFMVYTCMKQTDIQLVAGDYYEQEVAYQSTIDKVNNYQHLSSKPTIKDDLLSNTVDIDFSMLPEFTAVKGQVFFFRPSDSHLDFASAIELNKNGVFQVSKEKMLPGKWLVKLDWEQNSVPYFTEQSIYIQ